MLKNSKRTIIAHGTLLSLLIVLLTAIPTHAGDIVVIVNKSNNTSILSLRDLRKIYQGKKIIWSNGEPITLFLPGPRSQAMKALAQNVFNVDGAASVSTFYLKSVFQGIFTYPPKTPDNVIGEVAGTPGGIAIIDTGDVGDTSAVHVIRVGGL